MTYRRFAVIMAGGSGERFWPFSRRLHPKQMLKLADPDRSLIVQSVDRARHMVANDDVIIATAPHLVAPLREAVPDLPQENVIAEPHKRNTAGCLVWTAATLMARHAGEEDGISMAIITADHRVDPDEGFARTMDAALTVAEQNGGLATIGIRPDRPETGYGYIEVGDGEAHIAHDIAVRPVGNFREKPDAPTAQQYLDSGRYLWNSGTFFWPLRAFLDELEHAAPDLHAATLQIRDALAAGDEAKANAIFEGLRNISIDYALMERAKKVFVAEAAFQWDDVGSWDALERSLPSDADGNVTQGDAIVVDAKNNVILSNDPNVVVTVLGVEGLVVAVTGDAVLVLPKDRAQDVRQIVEQLKARGDARL